MKSKHLIFLSFFLMISFNSFSQAPNSFKYQSVIRKSDGTALVNQLINVKISILKGSTTGTPVYSEVHSTTSNAFGIVNLNIGEGTDKIGDFSSIAWSVDSYFVKVEMDESGGSNYTLSSVSQLLSVPFALYATKAGNGFEGNYNDLKNKLTAGNGILIDDSNKIINTKPDQIVNINAGAGIDVKGAYPNYSISSKAFVDSLICLSQDEILKLTPSTGNIVYNTTSNKVNVYNGSNWFELMYGDCMPKPTTAFAGPDQVISSGMTINITGSKPTYGIGKWEIITGSGTIQNASNYSTSFTANTNGSVLLLWSIKNSCGISKDTLRVSFLQTSPTITDYDGNVYQTISIGSQTWMKENLKSLHYSDGSIISGAYAYDNVEDNVTKYGRLYTWNAAMKGSVIEGAQGACPTGWHVPSKADWSTLTTHLGGMSIAGGKMKDLSTYYWNSPNTDATNECGFTALPAGMRSENSVFFGDRIGSYFWSSHAYDSNNADDYEITHISPYLWPYAVLKTNAQSLRCIKN